MQYPPVVVLEGFVVLFAVSFGKNPEDFLQALQHSAALYGIISKRR